jgi:uncharacterized protein with HEPN domain
LKAARDYRDFLNDMVMACNSIIRFVDGMTRCSAGERHHRLLAAHNQRKPFK